MEHQILSVSPAFAASLATFAIVVTAIVNVAKRNFRKWASLMPAGKMRTAMLLLCERWGPLLMAALLWLVWLSTGLSTLLMDGSLTLGEIALLASGGTLASGGVHGVWKVARR